MVEEKGDRKRTAQAMLIGTLCKIDDLDPVLGGKWKRGMLKYYSERLAELVLFDAGVTEPLPSEIVAAADSILALLAAGDLDGS